jgi:hypothetical protein
MYRRGNWSVFGVDRSALAQFKEALNNKHALLDVSAAVALVTCKLQEQSAVGINPYSAPRIDEDILVNPSQDPKAPSFAQMLNAYLGASAEDKAVEPTDLYEPFYGANEKDYVLDASRDWYGFWFVVNVWKDTNDVASLKEKLAYTSFERPYAFVTGDSKKKIDAEASDQTSILRKQFPVLIDFDEGLVFAENTEGPVLESLMELLKTLRAEPESRYWDFNDEKWPGKVLDYVVTNTKFDEEFAKRAEELTRFTKEEIEKLADKNMERIVSNFFAISELPNSLWIALKPSAQFKLYPASEAPLAASTPSNAYTLLNVTPTCSTISANLVFQELISSIKPNKEEQIIRKDLFSMTVDFGINNAEVGVAHLKGFDLPRLKGAISSEIKKTKVSPEIGHYWVKWLAGMEEAVVTFISSMRDVLEIPGDAEVGLKRMNISSDTSDSSTQDFVVSPV